MEATLLQLVDLNKKCPIDYKECLKLAKKLLSDGFDVARLSHQLSDRKLQLLILGAKQFRKEITHEYFIQSNKDIKILNKQLGVLLIRYLITFDSHTKNEILKFVHTLSKVNENNYQRILAIGDKEISYSFFGLKDWKFHLNLFDLSQALLILSNNINDETKTRWVKLFHKMIKRYPKNNLYDIQYFCMMNNFASAGCIEQVRILHSHGLELSDKFSHHDYVRWLMESEKDEDVCSLGSLCMQESFYKNSSFFDWIINSPHFRLRNDQRTSDRWYPALFAGNIDSLKKLFDLDPLTQVIIDSCKHWEINSLEVLEFLIQKNLKISTSQLITDNFDVLLFYKSNNNLNLKEFESLFFVWYAIEQKRKDVLDWFELDSLYNEIVYFFDSGPSEQECNRFVTLENLKFVFDYLFEHEYKITKMKDIYLILVCHSSIEILEYFFSKFDISYHDKICLAINTKNVEIVRHFYQKDQNWPLDIFCVHNSQMRKIEFFINTVIRQEFRCPEYKIGYNRSHRDEMIMAVDENGKWIQ